MLKMLNMLGVVAANVTDATQKVSQDVNFDLSRLPGTLKHMGIGMLSIFIVIGVIIAAVYLLNNNIVASLKNKSNKNK